MIWNEQDDGEVISCETQPTFIRIIPFYMFRLAAPVISTLARLCVRARVTACDAYTLQPWAYTQITIDASYYRLIFGA